MKSTPLSDKKKVFIALGVFFSLVVMANVALIYLAFSTFDGLVEDNYYKRGLNYQDEKDQGYRQNSLGWQVNLKKVKNIYSVSINDKEGKAVRGANVNLTFFRPTMTGFDQNYKLKENKPGLYEQPVDLSLKGIWDIYIDVEKEKNTWKKKQRITN